MKRRWFNRPRHFIVAGLIGLALCAVLLYIIEHGLTAPNPATLYYRQSIVLFAALILFGLSVLSLARGIWWGIAEGRAGQDDRRAD